MKADNAYRKFAFDLSELYGRHLRSYYAFSARLKSAHVKKQIDEMIDGVDPEINAMLSKVKMWIECAEKLAGDDPRSRDCLNYGLASGIALMAVCMDLAKPRGQGRPEKLIWDYVRQIYSENLGVKKSSIVRTAIERFKADHPKARKPKPEYLEKHFSAKVTKRGHS